MIMQAAKGYGIISRSQTDEPWCDSEIFFSIFCALGIWERHFIELAEPQ